MLAGRNGCWRLSPKKCRIFTCPLRCLPAQTPRSLRRLQTALRFPNVKSASLTSSHRCRSPDNRNESASGLEHKAHQTLRLAEPIREWKHPDSFCGISANSFDTHCIHCILYRDKKKYLDHSNSNKVDLNVKCDYSTTWMDKLWSICGILAISLSVIQTYFKKIQESIVGLEQAKWNSAVNTQ